MSSAVEEITVSVDQAEAAVKDAEVVERLMKNPDFEQIIKKGYFEQEAIRLVHAKADPNVQTPEAQADIDRDMRAIGALGLFIGRILQRGRLAKDSLEDYRRELSDARAEDMENGELN